MAMGGDLDRAHLDLVVEAAPNAIIVVDDEGRIVLVNAQVERLFGYERGELLGTSMERLVPRRFRNAHPTLRKHYGEAPTARPMGAGRDLFALKKDGREFPVEIGLSPFTTPHGNFVLASIIDITERKQAEELRLLTVGERRRRRDAEADRDRARDASQLKSQFVATMSHELRTPLNAIIGMAELLGSTQLDDRQHAFVQKINESSEALLGIINGILEFSKIEAGKVELEERELELDDLVGAAADVLVPQARRKGVALHAYVDPLIPPVLRGDPDRLRQVLLNLVGNAVKFTERGQIIIRALPVGAMMGRDVVVRFEVQDTGVGIPADVIPKLFEPFVQGDSSSSRTYGGTGLGLSISKRLVALMDGEIGVTSELGSGSLFWFTAGFARPASTTAPPHVIGGALLISEDETFAEIAVRYLSAWGMVTRRIGDPQEAAAVIDAGRAEGVPEWVAIVDVEIAKREAVVDALRSVEGLGRDRLIVVGSAEGFPKLVRQSQLFDRIVTALADDGEAPPAKRPAPALAQISDPSSSILVAEDNASMHDVLAHQFDALGLRVKIVSDGAQAVAAVRREHFDLVFMDCQMPNVDGFEATRRIRALPELAGVHVIAVTAWTDPVTEQRALAAGCDEVLSKPCPPALLMERVAAAIRSRAPERVV
jgi:PAS domain S-box-containing protein